MLCVAPLDDADTLPISLQRIGDDDAPDGSASLRERALFARPLIRGKILGDLGPETLEQLEGNTPIRCTSAVRDSAQVL